MNKLFLEKTELDTRDYKKYKMEIIYNNKIYIKETVNQLLKLYFLIFWNILFEISGYIGAIFCSHIYL